MILPLENCLQKMQDSCERVAEWMSQYDREIKHINVEVGLVLPEKGEVKVYNNRLCFGIIPYALYSGKYIPETPIRIYKTVNKAWKSFFLSEKLILELLDIGEHQIDKELRAWRERAPPIYQKNQELNYDEFKIELRQLKELLQDRELAKFTENLTLEEPTPVEAHEIEHLVQALSNNAIKSFFNMGDRLFYQSGECNTSENERYRDMFCVFYPPTEGGAIGIESKFRSGFQDDIEGACHTAIQAGYATLHKLQIEDACSLNTLRDYAKQTQEDPKAILQVYKTIKINTTEGV